jgi:inhibitor of KinA
MRNMNSMVFSIEQHTETSVIIYFGDAISIKILEAITCFNTALQAKPFDGFIEAVPAYVTLTIFYDPVKVLASDFAKEGFAFERVINYLSKLEIGKQERVTERVPIGIPVCYGGQFGPDIEVVARYNNISVSELVALHTDPIYTVHMLGFMPGFPYLGGMNEILATPRRDAARQVVPQGSVGIAGEQTGIYSLASPGGWQLIGRTPLKLFDPLRSPASLLSAGDRLRFAVITEAEFLALNS